MKGENSFNEKVEYVKYLRKANEIQIACTGPTEVKIRLITKNDENRLLRKIVYSNKNSLFLKR